MHAPPPPVAPLDPGTRHAVVRVAPVAIAFAVAGLAIVMAASTGHLSSWAACLAHAATAALAVWLARRAREPRGARALWLLAVGYGGVGALGALGTLLALALGAYYDRRATPLDEWRRALFPEVEVDPDAALWAAIGMQKSGRHPTIAPFVDVLDHGSLAQKQAVVALIARHFRPDFAPALRQALRDPQNAVRVQAATAVSLIEAQATSEVLELERQRRERPGDVDLLLEFARHEDRYAFTGLLDPAREEESRTRAVAAYRDYLAVRPGDVDAWHQLGRLFARLGRHEEALGCLREALRQGGTVQTRLWTMECLFHLRRFAELRELVGESAALMEAELQALPIETGQVLRLWGRGGAAVS